MLSHRSSAEKPSRIVVLGAKGFVASGLIRLLSGESIPHRSVGSCEVDLVEPSAVAKLRDIVQQDDAIVVTSALTPEKGRDRATFLKNVAMIDNLCAVLAEILCTQVVYISSDSVYDARCTVVDEDSCCESDDMYALSHIVREKLLLSACLSSNVPLTILRPCAIYGAGDTHNSYGPNRFMRTALRDGKITLFGQGEEQRDHIYISDVARLIRLCLLHRAAGVLNAATGTSLSFQEVACRVREVSGCDVVVESAPRRVPIVHRRFDTRALRQAFPDFEFTPFEGGIRESLVEMSNEPCAM